MSLTANSGTCPLAARAPARMIPPSSPVPDLASFDVILVNISAGKDSQAALDVTYRAAAAAGVTDRLVTVFCDLGDLDEWPSTAELGLIERYGDQPGARDLAAQHAAHYGIRHEVVFRTVSTPGGEVQQSLSEHIEDRGMWPDQARRYCTSDMKRAPVHKLLTRLARELRESGAVTGRRVRILNVMGLRAQESPKRAKMAHTRLDERASNQTVRKVTEWLPIHGWSVEDVWACSEQAGTRPHWAYLAGMPRLSCRFCVLASRLWSVPPSLTRRAPRPGSRWSSGWATSSSRACRWPASSRQLPPRPSPSPPPTGRRDGCQPGRPRGRRPRLGHSAASRIHPRPAHGHGRLSACRRPAGDPAPRSR